MFTLDMIRAELKNLNPGDYLVLTMASGSVRRVARNSMLEKSGENIVLTAHDVGKIQLALHSIESIHIDKGR